MSFQQIFPQGEENIAYAQYFTGNSYLAPLATGDAAVHNVTFAPACRNHWHIHHGAGQILLCTAGEGWYQEASQAARRLRPGDTVNIPAEVKHWHGAAKDQWFSHISVTVPKEGASTEWCEPVDDASFNAL